MTSMSDAWYEEDFKREARYRELKPKRCCLSCKHAHNYHDGTLECYVDICEFYHRPYPVAPFGLCDKYEPKPKEHPHD